MRHALNQLIFDVAEYGQESDRNEVLRRLGQLELYAAVRSTNVEFENGKKMITGPGMEIAIDQTRIQDRVFVRYLVNKDDPRLGEKFVGMSVAEVFDMIESGNDLDGLVFYNNKESFFGIVREDFPDFRTRYLSQS